MNKTKRVDALVTTIKVTTPLVGITYDGAKELVAAAAKAFPGSTVVIGPSALQRVAEPAKGGTDEIPAFLKRT